MLVAGRDVAAGERIVHDPLRRGLEHVGVAARPRCALDLAVEHEHREELDLGVREIPLADEQLGDRTPREVVQGLQGVVEHGRLAPVPAHARQAQLDAPDAGVVDRHDRVRLLDVELPGAGQGVLHAERLADDLGQELPREQGALEGFEEGLGSRVADDRLEFHGILPCNNDASLPPLRHCDALE